MNDTVALICANEIRPRMREMTDRTIEERIREAFRMAQGFWLTTDENTHIRGALAAVMLECSAEEKIRVERSLRILEILSAMMRGVPVDVEKFDEASTGFEPLPLAVIWREVKANVRST